MALDNFGIQFAQKTERRFWQSAVTPMIANTKYEGEIKKAGDTVRILSFLHEITFEDYVAGTDMTTQALFDSQDTLTVEKRKSFNFTIDRLEDLFTYADDVSDNRVESAAKEMEKQIDSYVLEFAAQAKAGNWVGINLRVPGATTDTMASIATTATGGTITIMGDAGATVVGASPGVVESPEDGLLYFAGFQSPADLGKPIRLTSGTTWATEWYRITVINSSVSVEVTNWDGATEGAGIPNGDILRGLYGGEEFTSDLNGDGKPIGATGWGWEVQAAVSTSVTAANSYEQLVLLAGKLDKNEIPDTERHFTIPSQMTEVLRNASELQPAIAMAYEGVILNGKVGRGVGFDIHQAVGTRVSTRVSRARATQTVGDAPVSGVAQVGYQMLANHINFVSFAYKWSESRVVDAENQFAKKYQGLHLYGAVVPALRRKGGAVLFGSF